jgi:hypothetical protein
MPSQKNAAPLYTLSPAETKTPLLVVEELFDFADLDDVRELLWSWLKATITGTYHKELSATERSAILTLYEKLEKLVEASHVMHTQLPAPKKRGAGKK